MRTLAAILAYLMAAASGLAVGYYTTAPRTGPPPLVAAAAGERHAAHTGRGGPADLDAVAAFLAAEERREESASRRTSAGL
jgi:hypothetical protein